MLFLGNSRLGIFRLHVDVQPEPAVVFEAGTGGENLRSMLDGAGDVLGPRSY
jgi:hypothetical protein